MVTVSNILVVIALVLAIIFLCKPASVFLLAVAIVLICASSLAGWNRRPGP